MKGMRYESVEVADVARYIADDGWAMEQKADGIRCIVSTDSTGNATFLSHTGQPLKSSVAMQHFAALRKALSVLIDCVVDGELLEDGRLWLFDVMQVLGTDTRLLPQADRRALLDTMQPAFGGTVVGVLRQAVTAADKQAMWEQVLAAGAEGVVVKRRSARYDQGKARTSDVLKIKVTRTIDVVVIGRDSDGHKNATLGLHRDGRLVEVGKCSMIGKADAQVGEVIEVTFLYVVDMANPALYQARMMRRRPDKAPVECEFDQLDGCQVSRKVVA